MRNNLTRDEARDRAGLLGIDSYQVALDLSGGQTTFRSATTVRFRCARPGASTFIELAAPSVSTIILNGRTLPLAAHDGERIGLTGLAEHNELFIEADCAYSRTGEGLHRFTDPADGHVYTYSDFEPYDAHRLYACFDQPDLKSPFQLTVTVPDGWQVVSNMPASGHDGRCWEFPPTPPVPTYITAVAAGPYHAVRAEHGDIPLGVFCRQSLARYLDADEILDITRRGLDYFQREFGVRFPFAKYDQLFVPEYKTGAMENAGCVTFQEHYLFRSRVTDAAREMRAETILHEMAHMWFGDLVTMRWWDDLWLNESFATWASLAAQTEATRWTQGWTTFAQEMKAWAYRQDQLPSTHPIAADIADITATEVNFDGITYAKGAAVLKQLVAYVGRDNFLAGLRDYFAAHQWGNATLRDLLAALERRSGRDLAAWSKAWLETAGVTTLRPDFETDADERMRGFRVLQEAPDRHRAGDSATSSPRGSTELRPHRIAIGLYERRDGALTRVRRVETDVAGPTTAVAEFDGVPRPDLVLVNDDDLSFAKIRLDGHSLRTLVGGIGELSESLPAALCWTAAYDMTRDAQMPVRDYLDLVLAGVGSITSVTMLADVLRRAALGVRRFAAPAWRPEGMARLASALRAGLERAEPGSDRQLAFAQAFAGVASSESDLTLLSGLLSGSAAIEGLAVDTELRWALLRRLAGRGAAGQAEINAELSRDPTDAGERYAAACRAAIPTAEAKQEAWVSVVSGELPNALFRATLSGFADLDADELLEPYAARYFAEVGRIWNEWGNDMSRFFAQRAYPATVVSQQALDAADAYLTRTDLEPALRRLVSEGRDDVARALRCRARDAGATAQVM